jgi:hypothetical protein
MEGIIDIDTRQRRWKKEKHDFFLLPRRDGV